MLSNNESSEFEFEKAPVMGKTQTNITEKDNAEILNTKYKCAMKQYKNLDCNLFYN